MLIASYCKTTKTDTRFLFDFAATPEQLKLQISYKQAQDISYFSKLRRKRTFAKTNTHWHILSKIEKHPVHFLRLILFSAYI